MSATRSLWLAAVFVVLTPAGFVLGAYLVWIGWGSSPGWFALGLLLMALGAFLFGMLASLIHSYVPPR
jgi:hypothetical protein